MEWTWTTNDSADSRKWILQMKDLTKIWGDCKIKVATKIIVQSSINEVIPGKPSLQGTGRIRLCFSFNVMKENTRRFLMSAGFVWEWYWRMRMRCMVSSINEDKRNSQSMSWCGSGALVFHHWMPVGVRLVSKEDNSFRLSLVLINSFGTQSGYKAIQFFEVYGHNTVFVGVILAGGAVPPMMLVKSDRLDCCSYCSTTSVPLHLSRWIFSKGSHPVSFKSFLCTVQYTLYLLARRENFI